MTRIQIDLLLCAGIAAILAVGCMDAPPQQAAHDNPWDSENPSAPRAPDRLRAYVTTETEVFIRWRDRSGNEDGFNIFESIENEIGMHLINVNQANVDSLIVMGRQVLTDYYYYIESFNRSGASFQTRVSASTKQAPPNAPDSLTIAVISADSIRIDWRDNSFVEDSFELEEAMGIPVNFYQISTAISDCTSVIVNSLAPNTTFWYKVRALNQVGTSTYSEPISVRIE